MRALDSGAPVNGDWTIGSCSFFCSACHSIHAVKAVNIHVETSASNLSTWTKGVFGMALELNSSNSSQFSSQTPQLQNSMELPTPWSCSANGGGVLEHLFCSSDST